MVYLAVLRAVNVTATWVRMSDLRDLIAGLGFRNVRTILQSGNVVFESVQRRPAELESTLEGELLRQLRLPAPVIVRRAADVARIVSGNPFAPEAERDPAHLVAVFLKNAPSPEAIRALGDAIVGCERIAVRGNTMYAVYPDGIGRSKLTAALIDRKLQTKGTARNWNTIMKLADGCKGSA
jgi:uncharacterized protein (DUF1697 family)